MTTIFESPPGTTPGPAPRTPTPWWKKPLTWIITSIAIVALGGASLAAYATWSGKTTVAPKPASAAPVRPAPSKPAPSRPAPSSPPGASAPASPGISQEQQLMSWFLSTGERHLKTIGSDESIAASRAQSLSNGNAADTSQLSADLAKVRQDMAVAQASQPPNDYHGFRAYHNAALSHLDKSVTDMQQVVADVTSGNYSAAMTDSQQANQEMAQWQSSLTRATDVLGVSASMQ
jgi:hypothetical protein